MPTKKKVDTKKQPSTSDAEEDEDLAVAVGERKRCESLQISFKEPLTSRVVLQDVFLDPRDEWRYDGFNENVIGDELDGGNLLLVPAAAVAALQQQADREEGYTKSTQDVTDACRRDFFRESQRLLESLDELVRKLTELEARSKADQAQTRAMTTHIQRPPIIEESDGEGSVAGAASSVGETDAGTIFSPPATEVSPSNSRRRSRATISFTSKGTTGAAANRPRRDMKSVLQDVENLRQKAVSLTEAAPFGWQKIVSLEDAQMLAQLAGPKTPIEPEAIEILEEVGFRDADLFTKSLTQKQLSEATEDLLVDRKRLRDLLKALEAQDVGGDLVEALILAARKDGVSLVEVVVALIDLVTDKDLRQKIEEKSSNGIKGKYTRLQKREEEIKPKVEEWRQMLSELDARRQEAKELDEEVIRLQEEAETKERLEKEARESWEQRKRERSERRQAKREAKRKRREEHERLQKDPNAIVDVTEYMAEQDRERLKKAESEHQAFLRKIQEQEDRRRAFEAKIEGAETVREELLERKKKAEERRMTIEIKVAETREVIHEEEERVKEAELKTKECKRKLRVLQDKYEVATAPKRTPPDTSAIEKELANAEMRNKELEDKASFLLQRVELYEHRWEKAEVRAKEVEDSMPRSAAAKTPKSRPQSRVKSPSKRPSDPLLMEYRDRLVLPEYSNLQRHLNLFNDEKARAERRKQRLEAGLSAECEKLLAKQKALSEATAGSASLPLGEVKPSVGPATTASVPVGFYRSEDLRLKRAGAARNVGQLSRHAQSGEECLQGLQQNLRSLGIQVGRCARDASEAHSEVCHPLEEALSMALRTQDESESAEEGANVQKKNDDEEVRAALLAALAEHKTAFTRSEAAWRFAENLCERGAPEGALNAEGRVCQNREEALTASSRQLFSVAEQVSKSESVSKDLAEAAESCLAAWASAEPRLVAARKGCLKAWPEVLTAAETLERRKKEQASVQTLLRSEETRRDLIDAELTAPAEVKRAFASVRALATGGARAGGGFGMGPALRVPNANNVGIGGGLLSPVMSVGSSPQAAQPSRATSLSLSMSIAPCTPSMGVQSPAGEPTEGSEQNHHIVIGPPPEEEHHHPPSDHEPGPDMQIEN